MPAISSSIQTEPEPAWDIARIFPAQGQWSEEEYLTLDTNYLVEFTHGHLEMLPMPTPEHQRIVAFLYRALAAVVLSQGLGEVLFAPLKVCLWPGKFREPDLVFMENSKLDQQPETYWVGPALVIEVVSPDNRQRDLTIKRREYAQAGIPEYWIVDPDARQITVLTLAGARYIEHGIFGVGATATSVLLADFGVDIDTLFVM